MRAGLSPNGQAWFDVPGNCFSRINATFPRHTALYDSCVWVCLGPAEHPTGDDCACRKIAVCARSVLRDAGQRFRVTSQRERFALGTDSTFGSQGFSRKIRLKARLQRI